MFRSPVVDAIVVVVIVLLIFGPKRLPELGKGLGRGMREFKEGITGDSKADEARSSLPSAPPAPDQVAPQPGEPVARQPGEQVPSQSRESAEVGSEPKS